MLTFDTALPVFTSIILKTAGEEAFRSSYFLRDVSGKLTLIVPERFPAATRQLIAEEAERKVVPYVDEGGMSIASPSDLFDDRLICPSDTLTLRVKIGTSHIDVRVLDRRMVGADWVRRPNKQPDSGRRLAFTSLKGGVGRTTALCVLAASLVAEGKSVLAVDLDLEAPGLGNMLLKDDTVPLYGMLDYLVESSMGRLDDAFIGEMVGSSWLGAGHGVLDVVPAIGSRAGEFPENVLGKIARAYLAVSDADGRTTTFADHVAQALDRLCDRFNYDVVLIDARAGLHETTAASILGLGAKVLCFGLDQPQTYADYKLLCAHLATVTLSDAQKKEIAECTNTDLNSGGSIWPADCTSTIKPFDWSELLIIIQGKAPASMELQRAFAEKMSSLYQSYLRESTDPLAVAVDVADIEQGFVVDWDPVSAEVVPIPDEGGFVTSRILSDERYALFNPLSSPDTLDSTVYEATYGAFIETCRNALDFGSN